MNTNATILFRFARFSAYAVLGSSLSCAAVGDLGDDDDPKGSTTSTAMSTHGSLETTSSAGTTSATASTIDTSGLASTSSAESLTSGTEESGLASDDATTGIVCDPGDCEEVPRPNAPCADGSTPHATCVPLEGRCAWSEDACPEPCTEDECGTPPPTALCPDGMTHSGVGPCERNDDGVCTYTILECPLCCSGTQLPDCPEPITCCADGTWLCGTPDECPDGATAFACEIPGCQPEGASCASGEPCCSGSTCCAGVPVLPGEEYCSSTCPVSDRARKANFAPVDVRAILDKVAALEITTWNYTFEDPSIRHVGPMAQDFQAAFVVGATDKAIFQIDADGVALAAIQALHREVEDTRAENTQLRRALERLESRLNQLEARPVQARATIQPEDFESSAQATFER